MRGAGRALALTFAASLAGSIGAVTACERLEMPCSVAGETAIAEVSGAASRGVFAATDFGNPAVLFFVRNDAPEAGALGLPDKIEIVVLDRDAERETRRESFKLPARLSARKGGTESVGVAWGPGRALFHWVEIATRTEPDGRTRTTSTLVLQESTLEAGDKPTIEPPAGRCEDCRVDVDAIDFGGQSLVVYGRFPALGDGRAPTLGGFAIDRSGVATSRALPPEVAEGSLPRFDVVDGQLVLVGRSALVPVDTTLTRAGPVLPRPNPNDTIVSLAGEPLVVWTERGDDAGGSGSEPDLLFRRFDREGRAVEPARRASTTTRISAASRSGDRVGILHRSSQTYFSLARVSGDKIGGDLALGPSPSTGDHLVVLPGGNFRALSAEGTRVVRREIVCAP